MEGQPVEERAGETFVAERASPFVKRQVRGDDGGAALVALADQFEQEFCAGLGQRHEAQLVDDQELHAGKLQLEAQQAFSSWDSIISCTIAAAVTKRVLMPRWQAASPMPVQM